MITFKQYIFENRQAPLLEMRDFSLKDGYWLELIKIASLKFYKYEKEFINWLKNGKGKKWFLNTYQPTYPNKDAGSILHIVSLYYWYKESEEYKGKVGSKFDFSPDQEMIIFFRAKKAFVQELYKGFKLEQKQQQVKDAISKNDNSGWDL